MDLFDMWLVTNGIHPDWVRGKSLMFPLALIVIGVFAAVILIWVLG